jgi:hypothetical protein
MTINKRNQIKAEFMALRSSLPGNWKSVFLAKHPRWNNLRGINKLNNISRGLSTDVRVLEFCKILVKNSTDEIQSH